MIQRNRHPAGRFGNMLFGLACIIDGAVRFLTLGYYHTTLQLKVSRYQTKLLINKLRVPSS